MEVSRGGALKGGNFWSWGMPLKGIMGFSISIASYEVSHFFSATQSQSNGASQPKMTLPNYLVSQSFPLQSLGPWIGFGSYSAFLFLVYIFVFLCTHLLMLF